MTLVGKLRRSLDLIAGNTGAYHFPRQPPNFCLICPILDKATMLGYVRLGDAITDYLVLGYIDKKIHFI